MTLTAPTEQLVEDVSPVYFGVVDQDIAVPKDKGRPDDGVGDADALQRFFHLLFAPEVGQPGV